MLSIMMVSALVGASWTTTIYEFTPKYDAQTTFGFITNDSDSLKIKQQSGFNPDTFGLMSFNISTIDDTSIISDVSLNYTSRSGDANEWVATRMNGSDVNNNADFVAVIGLKDAEGNYFNDIGLTAHENEQTTLGATGISDLQDQLSVDYFTTGFTQTVLATDEDWSINSSESDTPPLLIVETDCSYSGSGDWIIGTTCIMSGEEVTLASSDNLFITSNGYLDMREGSNVSFTGSNQFINIDIGGNVNVCKGCALPK